MDVPAEADSLPKEEDEPKEEDDKDDVDVDGEEHAGDDNEQTEKGEAEEKISKPRTLEQMMSLKPGDDERTEISKKISWILRHGAKRVNIEIDPEGWIKINDMLGSDILKGGERPVTREKLDSVIEESNLQKTRYEIKETDDGQAIRAVSKNTMGIAGGTRERRRKDPAEGADRGERPPRGERGEKGGKGELREWQTPPGGKGTGKYDGNMDRGERHDGGWRDNERQWRREDEVQGGQGQDQGEGQGQGQDGSTFEQQVREGFRPVYHGDRVVAMVKDGVTVKPGRRCLEGADGGDAAKGIGSLEGGLKGDRRGKGDPRAMRQDRGDRLPWQHDGSHDHRMDGRADNFRPRWRVVPGQDALVRAGEKMESETIGTLRANTVVVQTGEEKILQHGIIRMPVESLDPQEGLKGWVTRTAEQAGGPAFFKPERVYGKGAPRGQNDGGNFQQQQHGQNPHHRGGPQEQGQQNFRDPGNGKGKGGKNHKGSGRGGYQDHRDGGKGKGRKGGYGDGGLDAFNGGHAPQHQNSHHMNMANDHDGAGD